MMLRNLHRKATVLALLLFCLSGSLWLQGEHIHLQDHGPVHDCAVCHHGSAAAVGQLYVGAMAAQTLHSVTLPVMSAIIDGARYHPPARAPPFYSV